VLVSLGIFPQYLEVKESMLVSSVDDVVIEERDESFKKENRERLKGKENKRSL
jgi:hypothetical protein